MTTARAPRGLWIVVAVLGIGSLLLIALRDPLIVPAITGEFGSTWVQHRVWTPLVTAAALIGLCGAFATAAIALLLHVARRSR